MLSVVLSSEELEDENSFSASVKINGEVIMARSCYNTGERDEDGRVRYKVDDGSEVYHFPDDGAKELAKKLLDTIEDPDIDCR